MTTVIYDGVKVVSDTQCSGMYLEQFHVDKVFEYEIDGVQVYLCIAGTAGIQDHVIDWVSSGCDPESVPKNEFEAIMIGPEGCCMFGTGYPYLLEAQPPLAIGTGSPYAMGALLTGATAEAALGAASKLDPYTNSEMRVYEINMDRPSEDGAEGKGDSD